MQQIEGLNCEFLFHPAFIEEQEANQLFQKLMQFEELHQLRKVFSPTNEPLFQPLGKITFVDRELIEKELLTEEVFGTVYPMSEELMDVQSRIQETLGTHFEVCVCILFKHGGDCIDYHSDYPAFGRTDLIPSLSLGDPRIFLLKEITSQEEHRFKLRNGDLVVMGKYCQERYQHAVPEDPNSEAPRINLTFRKYGLH